MHRTTTIRRLLLGGLAALFGGSALAQMPPMGNQPGVPPAATAIPIAEAKLGPRGELLVPTGGTVQFTPKLPPGKFQITKVTSDKPGILDFRDEKNSIVLIGQSSGFTTLTITITDITVQPAKELTFTKEVLVQPDYTYLKTVFEKAVPTASIEIIPGVGNTIILSGYVNRPEDADLILQIARAATGAPTSTSSTTAAAGTGTNGQPAASSTTSTTTGASNIINAIQVGGLQHVQIEVVFASVNRSDIRTRGVNLLISGGGNGTFFSNMLGGEANITASLVPANFQIALAALKAELLAKVISEPKLVTQSGRPATIFSGGQQATLGQTGGALQGASVQLVPFGTTLTVLPIVYGNGKIYLEINPRFTAVDFANGIAVASQAGGGVTNTPGFVEQSVQSSVMLESGQTYAIGGLIQNTNQSTVNKIPIFGELPYVGPLFSNSRVEQRETELIVLVTPRLVDAMDCNQTPRTIPGRETRNVDDYEFFLEGLIEAPRGQRQVWDGRCYNAAWRCDPFKSGFPCVGNVCGANGNGKGNCNTATPTSLPGTTTVTPVNPTAVTPATPATAALAPLPQNLPAAPATTPAAEPIIMPQVVPSQAPVETPVETPVTPGPASETPAAPPVAPSEIPVPVPPGQ